MSLVYCWALSGVLAGTGCQAAPPRGLAAGPLPDFPSLLAMPGSEVALARGQKPQGQGRKGLLEIGPNDPGSKDSRGARIRAVVNNEAILEDEVIATAFHQLNGVTEEEKAQVLNKVLEEIIDREVIMQDAIQKLSRKGGERFLKELTRIASEEFEKQWLYRLMKANKEEDPEKFKKALRESGMPYDLIRRSWERNFIAMEYLRSRISPTMEAVGHRQIAEYYDRHPEEFRVEEKLVWQDLFIATARHPNPEAARKFAESLAVRIRQGADFAKLAKEFDNGDASYRPNAEGIGTRRGEVRPPEAEPHLYRLKDGEVGPVIELPTGYHVIRRVKHAPAGRKPFDDDVQKQIREKLKGKVFQEEMKRIVGDLRRLAVIEIARDIK